MLRLLKKIANDLDQNGLSKQASKIDGIIDEIESYSDVELLQKYFGERGLKKGWREKNLYKTSSMAAIENKKAEYLKEVKSKKKK